MTASSAVTDIGYANNCRGVLYARGSSPQQTTAQLLSLRNEAGARGLSIVGEYLDLVLFQGKHPEMDLLMSNIRQGQVGVLMIVSLHTLGLPLRQAVLLLAELASRGVNVIALQDGIDTTSEAGQAAMVAITALTAADKSLAKERGKASVTAARRRGSRIGRPRAEVDLDRAVELRAQGMSYRLVAQAMGVGVATVHRALSVSNL